MYLKTLIQIHSLWFNSLFTYVHFNCKETGDECLIMNVLTTLKPADRFPGLSLNEARESASILFRPLFHDTRIRQHDMIG